MEDSKLIKIFKFLIPIFLSGFFIFSNNALAYEIGVHAFLTDKVIEFYNQNFENKIPEEFNSYLIDGSRREDDDPRYLNHFYDPVFDRGLMDIWQKSKNWAQDRENQNSLVYKVSATIASILTAIQQGKISAITKESDFTWQRAIDFYLKGEKEKAFFVLGHILHLIQDASVPDHTRNDPHPGDSVFENWTAKLDLNNSDKNLTQRLENKKPVILSDLNSYFDGIAIYSNNNFYSKDTIDKDYIAPKADYSEVLKDGRRYEIYIDEEFGDYPLIKTKNLLEFNSDELLNRPLIIAAYWSRLSVKAVQYSAGAIDLFFREVEKAEKETATIEQEKKSFFALAIESVKNIFGGNDEEGNLAAEISLESEINKEEETGEIEPIEQVKQLKQIEQIDQINPTEIEEEVEVIEDLIKEINTSKEEPEPPSLPELEPALPELKPEIQICNFETSQNPTHQKLIINEVAWMGTVNSANDEWIEFKNISSEEIDLTNWHLIDKDEQINIQLEGKLPAGGFYFLERTNDDSVPAITADKIYTGALANVGEGLHLFDKNCILIDEVFAAPDWPAGDNIYKKTMERQQDFSWRHYSGEGQNNIYGTPKAENSKGTEATSGGGGGRGDSGGGSSANNQTSVSDQSGESNDGINKSTHILISEILFDAESSDTGKEFIELYNPTDQVINLADWSIQHLSVSGSLTKKNFETGDQIVPHSFFLIWLGINERADMIWSSGSLNNTQAAIYLVNSHENIDINHPIFADSVDYNIDQFPGFSSGKSLERKAYQNGVCISAQTNGEFLGNDCDTDNILNDFELRAVPNPQNTQSLPEPRPAPAAVQDFNISYNSSTLELIFDWAATSTLSYKIPEISSATITPPVVQLIQELGRSYQFSLQAFDQDGLGSEIASQEINIPNLISNLHFYKKSDTEDYFIDFSYQNYPFVPSVYNRPDTWKILVFYLNQEASTTLQILNSAMNWQPDTEIGIIEIKYEICAGSYSPRKSLILPDTLESCGTGGGVMNMALDFDLLEDNYLNLEIKTSDDFSEEDYLTVAFYDFEVSGGGNQGFRLAATDKTKYYFQNEEPLYQPPNSPQNLTFSFTTELATSSVRISWEEAIDPDTLDSLLQYQWRLNDGEWQATLGNNYTETELAMNNTYTIAVRTFDPDGNFSEPAVRELILPPSEACAFALTTNNYYVIDCVKKKDNLIKIQWRLLQDPSPGSVFGIIPFLADTELLPLATGRALHKDFTGNSVYPLTTARPDYRCNNSVISINEYNFGEQYLTNFSSISGVSTADIFNEDKFKFNLYRGMPCSFGQNDVLFADPKEYNLF